jgi:K+ transporter
MEAISVAALLATALFYGDAVITPAISILSSAPGRVVELGSQIEI